MKSLNDMNGAERAAALLVALGPDIASEVMKHLDEDSISILAGEIAKIDALNPEDKEDLIGEFLLELKKKKGSVTGGQNVAKELLFSAFGKEKAEDILRKLTHQDLEKGFDFLSDVDSEIIITLIQNEHPQTVAVTLAYLPSRKAAEVLKGLSQQMAKEVTIRMAKMEKTSPDAVLEVSRVLRKKYDEHLYSGSDVAHAGGLNALVDIMGHMSGEQEKHMMEYFDTAMPDISSEIRAKIFTFENVLNLTNPEVQVLIDELGDDYVIARSLKGAGDDLRVKFVRNMSKNRATDVLSEMEAMGPVRLSEINESRDEIVRKMRELHDSGIINLRKDREQYVE